METKYGVEGENIFRVNDDGSVTNVAVIDMESADVKPYECSKWYSELLEEKDELSHMKDNYNGLLSLAANTNKQIIATKSSVTSIVSKSENCLKIPMKSFLWSALFVFLIIGMICISYFWPELLSPNNKIFQIVAVAMCAVCFIALLIVLFLSERNTLNLLDEISNLKADTEKLSVLHCNEKGVYDFIPNINLSSIPMIISDVLICNTDYNGNVDTGYGEKIQDYRTMYLKPKIKYFGIKSGVQTLRIRWIKPDGSISKGTASIGDFSQIAGYEITAGKSSEVILSGWGGSDKGHWCAGQYFIEIWHEDIRLFRKPFTIY